MTAADGPTGAHGISAKEHLSRSIDRRNRRPRLSAGPSATSVVARYPVKVGAARTGTGTGATTFVGAVVVVFGTVVVVVVVLVVVVVVEGAKITSM